MRALELNRRLFTLVSVYPPSDDTRPALKYFYKFYGVFVIVVQIMGICCGTASGISTGINDFESTLYTIFEVAGSVMALYSICFALYLRERIVQVFEKYDELHNTGEKQSSNSHS